MTPASAETVHRPHNTTTPSTSSAFIGIWPDTSIQPPLGIQCHTSIFCSFQSNIWNVWGRHQGCSCESLITTSQCECCLCRHVESPWFPGVGFLQLPDWNYSKKGTQQGCTCSWTLQVGKNSQYEFLVSILTGLKCGQFYNIWSLVLCRLSDTGFCRNSSSAT